MSRARQARHLEYRLKRYLRMPGIRLAVVNYLWKASILNIAPDSVAYRSPRCSSA
jgi:hypothetical protein